MRRLHDDTYPFAIEYSKWDLSFRQLEPIAETQVVVDVDNSLTLDFALGSVLNDGESYFGSGDGLRTVPHLACAPLKVKGAVVGAISITKLLDQKRDGLTAIDREILSLLSDHAATALVSADLHSRTERKLRTIEGFIDLLKPDEKQPAP